ncbi:TRC40/GET3/ArsA family transport-energizing ATPase [Paenibacillus oenotherae]|uniref:TRC40/GET3/ArsA family transport-energizing ATPase n=1 Tax=Paenibacillus oenotherae TaxID=1435645 RepID=A0ABS7D5U7_9BACL|nr:TRC40/GET3/ArsA family transport-energizing ATPase [Paenibacillus oenotherae]MBW7475153.1 TRC40/GET3/ArsA family transport-energizing ATPase [Paenibacillus oenotherae]
MRIIIYTGKGGVGKTSVAAATAVRLAAQGTKTLVMSTDAAHSLSDALDLPLGPDPVQVAPHLWAQEIDSMQETERNWGAVQSWLSQFMNWAKLNDVTTEEMLVFPGMEELFCLLQIKRQADSGLFDTLIVDCAPTGETLRLLSYPNVLNWWLEKIFPHERRLIKVMRPVAKLVTGGLELPSDETMHSVEQFVHDLEDLQTMLLNPEITSVRLVLNPEKMVISEARRSFTYLNLFGFHTDAVIVNRVLQGEVGDGFMAQWKELHLRYEGEIEQCFSPLPILRVPLMPGEVFGLEPLSRVGEEAFRDADAGAILYAGRTETIRKDGEMYTLELLLPFISKDQVGLTQLGDELTVHVGSYKRKIHLPRTLMGRPIEGARFREDALHIRFGKRE